MLKVAPCTVVRSYSRTTKFFGLDGLQLFCIVMGLRSESSAITFRTLLHLGPNFITFRTLLHSGQLLHLGPQHHSGQMSSKTMLIGHSNFRCGHEKSVHGRPSWELTPYDCTSQITKDLASWCKLVSKECRFCECAGECGVVHFSTQFFFFLDKAKALPIRIGS